MWHHSARRRRGEGRWRALHAASRAADRWGPAAWTYGLYLWGCPAQKAVLEFWTLDDRATATDVLADVAVMPPWLNVVLALALAAALPEGSSDDSSSGLGLSDSEDPSSEISTNSNTPLVLQALKNKGVYSRLDLLGLSAQRIS